MIHCRYHKRRRARGSKRMRLCGPCYFRWYRKHKGKPEEQRDRHLKRTYGITTLQFNKLWNRQGQVCKICKETPKKQPHVDHDHKTGKVRGILCNKCNLGLGMFKDDVLKLKSAILYLRRSK